MFRPPALTLEHSALGAPAIAWPTHACIVCAKPAELDHGAPVWRWGTGAACCWRCWRAARDLPGDPTIARVRRLLAVAA